jgi:hypothetical protein
MFLQQWSPSFSMQAIAVDATHNAVYLISFGTTDRFTLTGGDKKTIDSGSGVALALDAQLGNLYVDHGHDVAVYAPVTGDRIDTLFTLGKGSTTNSQGLAFHASGKGTMAGQSDLYVSDASNNNVTIYAPHKAGPPFISAESARTAGLTSETLKGAIVPLGNPTTCIFQYVGSADFQASGYTNAITVPCTPANLGSSFTYQEARATVTGLTLGAFYHFHVVATSSAGTTTGADQTFQAGPGDWTPFTRCPVDDPAMLATDGSTTIAVCLASNSTHGSIKVGNTTTVTGNSNLQVGLVVANGAFTVIGPPGGALVAASAQVTAGGQTVIATVESAGVPSNFNFIAGIEIGVPIITIPVKIHLESLPGAAIDLGPSCFIGSDQSPILLNPENTDLSGASAKFESFDPDGTPDPAGPLQTIVVSGAVQGDSTFAVPGAQGCGTNGSLDVVVNAVAGLPSPSGNNNVVLDDASSALALLPNQSGQQFAHDWHAVFGGP